MDRGIKVDPMAASNVAVSVLMPVYNAERYVAESVESILTQTFTDFEFLIVDDGSTDRSLSILKRYAKADSRIKLKSRPNTGMVGALNEMIEVARGEYLARIDADDSSLPGRFMSQVDYLRENTDVVCAGTKCQIVDYKGRCICIWYYTDGHDSIQRAALLGKVLVSHSSVMMRRQAILRVSGYRQEFWPAEDLDLWLRLGEIGRVEILPETLSKVRLHDGSVSAQHQMHQISCMKAVLREAYQRRGIEDKEITINNFSPSDRLSRMRFFTWIGWSGLIQSNRFMAFEYGLKAVRTLPWHPEAWYLLGSSLVRSVPSCRSAAEKLDPPV